MRRGGHALEYKVLEIYPLQDVQIGLLNTGGTDPRWSYIGDCVIVDDDFAVALNNVTMTDNFMILFDDDQDAVLGSMSFDHKDNRFRATGGGVHYWYLDAVDETFWVSHSPFSLVANLFAEAENEPRGTATLVTDAAASPLAGANNAVLLDAIGDYTVPNGEYSAYTFTAGTDLPAGRYVAVIRARYVDVETMEMYVYNSSTSEFRNEENARVNKVLTALFAYWCVIFDITDTEAAATNNFAIVAEKTNANANVIHIDYHLIVPIGDGMNFPQDLAHSALRGITQHPRLSER